MNNDKCNIKSVKFTATGHAAHHIEIQLSELGQLPDLLDFPVNAPAKG